MKSHNGISRSKNMKSRNKISRGNLIRKYHEWKYHEEISHEKCPTGRRVSKGEAEFIHSRRKKKRRKNSDPNTVAGNEDTLKLHAQPTTLAPSQQIS